jgi:hypothetical protein
MVCVPLLSIPSSRHLFNTAMANTNRCNLNTMNPADRRRGCRGKGTGKEGAPPARRSDRTNPSAAVGDFVDPRLLKPPPESIPHAPGAGDFVEPRLLKPPPESVCVLTWSPGGGGRLPNVRTIEPPSSCPPP